MQNLFLIFATILVSIELFAQSIRDDFTAGSLALKYRRQNNFWFKQQMIGIDASVTTSPPNMTFLDRRVETDLFLGQDIVVSDRFGIRLGGKAFASMRKQQEKTPPIAPQTSKSIQAVGFLDFTYLTPKGLEIFIGLQYQSFLPSTLERNSGIVSSRIHYNSGSYSLLRTGLIRRGSTWSGGFYFVSGKESERAFKAFATDGTNLSGQAKIYTPSEYGIVAGFESSGGQFDFDFASVQAGEGGERTDQGSTIHDDFLRMRVGYFLPLGGGGLYTAIGHQTLSYASNAFATVDTIPFTTLKISCLIGEFYNHMEMGVFAIQGKDKTSITEFNASYNYFALGTVIGIYYPF